MLVIENNDDMISICEKTNSTYNDFMDRLFESIGYIIQHELDEDSTIGFLIDESEISYSDQIYMTSHVCGSWSKQNLKAIKKLVLVKEIIDYGDNSSSDMINEQRMWLRHQGHLI